MTELTKDQFDGLLKGFAKTVGLEKTYTEAELQEKLRQQREADLEQLRSVKDGLAKNADFINKGDAIEDRYYRTGLLHAVSALDALIDNNGEEG